MQQQWDYAHVHVGALFIFLCLKPQEAKANSIALFHFIDIIAFDLVTMGTYYLFSLQTWAVKMLQRHEAVKAELRFLCNTVCLIDTHLVDWILALC